MEQKLAEQEEELYDLRENVEWVEKHGFVGVIDKVVELREFSTRLLRVRSACLAAGEVAGRAAVAQQVAAGTFDPANRDGPLCPLDNIQAALESIVSADYADILGLGSLEINGVRALVELP